MNGFSAVIKKMKEQPEDVDERPWERPGRVRRDCEPHRAELLRQLGTAAIVCGFLTVILAVPALIGLPLGIAVSVMANRDLAKMRAGEMDPQGEADTERARQIACFSLLVSGAMLFGCGIPVAIVLLRGL